MKKLFLFSYLLSSAMLITDMVASNLQLDTIKEKTSRHIQSSSNLKVMTHNDIHSFNLEEKIIISQCALNLLSNRTFTTSPEAFYEIFPRFEELFKDYLIYSNIDEENYNSKNLPQYLNNIKKNLEITQNFEYHSDNSNKDLPLKSKDFLITLEKLRDCFTVYKDLAKEHSVNIDIFILLLQESWCKSPFDKNVPIYLFCFEKCFDINNITPRKIKNFCINVYTLEKMISENMDSNIKKSIEKFLKFRSTIENELKDKFFSFDSSFSIFIHCLEGYRRQCANKSFETVISNFNINHFKNSY